MGRLSQILCPDIRTCFPGDGRIYPHLAGPQSSFEICLLREGAEERTITEAFVAACLINGVAEGFCRVRAANSSLGTRAAYTCGGQSLPLRSHCIARH